MGRIRKYIDVGERRCLALFDTGARNTYVIKEIASKLPNFDLPIKESL
ncbi:MAG: hypothetical protein SCARUB_00205 [Candidatus Scalindua rubra]|uniref:Peptidase A2 domain-containing protein n=1 Tax=Candidatus Scalindua rubra TaxID=1872076 RepID=A0A1E3XG63_9BACT|nr:MAG: hypothetical protein SCARUB_00205 [Candidatus Scalindua rubra]